MVCDKSTRIDRIDEIDKMGRGEEEQRLVELGRPESAKFKNLQITGNRGRRIGVR